MTDWEYLERRAEIEAWGCLADDDEKASMREQLDHDYDEEDEYRR